MPLKLIPPRSGKTPYYSVRGTYLGRYVDRSTKSSEKSVAKKVLATIQREIEDGRFTTPREKTFAAAALAYMNAGGERAFMAPLLHHFGNTPLTQIGQDEIDEAAEKRYRGRSNATKNRCVYTPVNAVLRRAGIVLGLKRPKEAQGRKIVDWLRPDEATRLFISAQEINVEFSVLLITLCYTGMRLREALDGMKIDKLDLNSGWAFVSKTKNGKPRPVFLPPPVIAALRRHPRGLDRPGQRVFRFHKGGRLYDMLREAADKAGVRLPKRSAFHLFRHTYGTWSRRYGGLDTRGMVGTGAWDDPRSAERYAHVVVTEEAMRAARFPHPDLPPLLTDQSEDRGESVETDDGNSRSASK